MNIFATSSCPIQSAAFLDSKRTIKMILESAQMLCTTLHLLGMKPPYKPTHINHPCTVWVRQSRQNYMWLVRHFEALCSKYKKFSGKTHKCEQFLSYFIENADLLPDTGLTAFANCAKNLEKGLDFSNLPVHIAYEKYLIARFESDIRLTFNHWS
jgi:hypothetical protein